MGNPKLTNKLLILLGDGGDPEIFSFPCGARARGMKLSKNTGEEVLLDCDDPLGSNSFVSRWVESDDTSLNIVGRVSKQAWPMWRAWGDASDEDAEKNIRVELEAGNVGVGGHYALPAILQEFEITSEGKESVAFTATIVGAGARVWVPAV